MAQTKIINRAHVPQLKPTSNIGRQMVRYALVSLIAAVVDAALLFVFTECVFHRLPDPYSYMVSQVMSSLCGGLVNYALSCTPLVFGPARTKTHMGGFLLFTLIGAGGLAINILFLWLFSDIIGLYYMVAKAIAVVAVFCWNFFIRKYMLFNAKNADVE